MKGISVAAHRKTKVRTMVAVWALVKKTISSGDEGGSDPSWPAWTTYAQVDGSFARTLAASALSAVLASSSRSPFTYQRAMVVYLVAPLVG